MGRRLSIVTLYYEGIIKIIDVTDSSNPKLLIRLYTGKKSMGIGLFPNKNFIVVQSYEKLKVIEIRNASNPVIVNDYSSSTITPVYQIAVTDDAIIYPTNEILNIYYGETFYFPDMTSQTNAQGQKIFIVQLFPVNPKSLDKTQQQVSLLAMDTEEVWPFWMTMNFDTNFLIITPPSKDSLTVTRKIKLIFGTQISSSELADIWPENNGQPLQFELMLQKYIDSINIPTKNYNPNIPITFNNATFNNVSTQITALLNSHLKYHSITFVLNDFIELDTPPNLNLNLQKQWDTYVFPEVNKRVDFQFNPNSFLDPDGDKMAYSVADLPSFLQFYKDNMKLYGTPTKYDLGVYNVTIEANDGYKSIDQKFTITVKNDPPISIFPGNNAFILGENFDWQLPSLTFSDPDGDELSYSLKMIDSNNQEVYAPSWINLDSSRIRIYGKPEAKDIASDEEKKRYYQVFPLRMIAKDIVDQNCSFDFNLTVSNYYPIYNINLTLQEQFERKYGSYVKLLQLVDFEFSKNTFLDQDSSVLTYTVSGLPHWLTFTGTSIYGTTKKEDLGNYSINIMASDGYSNATGVLLVPVLNHPPTSSPIEDKLLILGHQLNLSFVPADIFSDPDNDVMTYRAFLFENESNYVNLPGWMTFDAETFSFHGMADKYWVPYDAIQRNYYKEEKICLFAYDPGDANSSTCFTLVIKSNLPYENELKSLVSQFKFFKPTVSVDLEIVLESDTFLDQNNDTISYNIRLVDEYNPWPEMPEYSERRLLESDSDSNGPTSAAEDTEPLPAIMTYDAETRKLSISPTPSEFLHEYTIRIIAKNSMLEEYVDIQFTVGMSMIYAFNTFLTIVGTVGGIIGLYVYRIKIYAMFSKRLYSSTEFEIAEINEHYQKNFYLIQSDLDNCLIIWNEIKKKYKKQKKNLSLIFNLTNREVLASEISENAETLIANHTLSPHINLNSKRMVEIFEGFLILEVIAKRKKLNKVFKRIKKILKKRKLRNWYDDFVKISQPLAEDKFDKPFPSIEFIEDKLEEAFAEALKNSKINPKFLHEFTEEDQILIKKAIKTDILGIPLPSSRLDSFLEFSRGESIWGIPTDIAEIYYEKVAEETESVHGGLFDAPTRNMYNPIQNWLKYTISEDVLIFSGTPTFADCGKYIIKIFNKDDVIIREFGIHVKAKDFDKNVSGKMFASKATGLLKETLITSPTSPSPDRKPLMEFEMKEERQEKKTNFA